ncbi:hemolysin family protein [Lachnospiraceae bacterium ZAX-1]
MDDGGSPAIGLFVFFALLCMDAMLYGFMAAIERLSKNTGSPIDFNTHRNHTQRGMQTDTNRNKKQIDKVAYEEGLRGKWLQAVMDKPYDTIHTLQIMVTLISGVLGAYQVHLFGNLLVANVLKKDALPILHVLCYGAVAVATFFLLLTIGIRFPQKIAAAKADQWVRLFAGAVRTVTILARPFAFLCEKLSDAAVKACRIDPKKDGYDLTEDEIISIVEGGNEQGLLLDNEAKMIHNVIDFAQKDAKDIMTHRKNVVAVDANMKLCEALEFMLEKNNSRFPVYQDDIDNIIGIVHIKDAMIQSRTADFLDQPLHKVQGLIREIGFIPETRKISVLFKTMQSEKNQLAIVVDEYGQTAGLVAMEDILEEIVGEILDEYDEDDHLIVEQMDGSYTMSGMAPLDEVCEILHISTEIEDYETLNGYLISLIDKIPDDNEQFEIRENGYLYQILAVENKMIQTVQVRKIKEESGDEACQDIPNLPT